MTGEFDLTENDGGPDHEWANAHFAAPNSSVWLPVGASSRRVGRSMQTIAVFGVVVAAVAGIVTWNFLGDLERNVDRSLVIGANAAVTLSETIDVADALIVTLDDGLVAVSGMIESVGATIDNVTGVADAASDLATTLPNSFVDIDAALVTVQDLGATVDTALSALAILPFGPDYDPEVPFPQAIGNLRDSLAPLGEQLTVIGEELGGFADSSGALASGVEGFLANIDASRDALSDTQVLLDSYRVAADDASDLAITSRTDLNVTITWIRLVVVLLALLIAAGQLMPWWLGSRLVEAESPKPEPLARVGN